MTDKDYTHITLVVDRSLSMKEVKDDAQEGVNKLLADQKTLPGAATLTLVEFNAPYYSQNVWQQPAWNQNYIAGKPNVGWDYPNQGGYWVLHDDDLATAPQYKLIPSGNTALYDAVGRAIKDTGTKLASLAENRRPDKVILAIQTDGDENHSTRFTFEQVESLIREHETRYNWQIVWMGMGMKAVEAGRRLGINFVTNAVQTGDSYRASYSNLSSTMSAYRMGGASSMRGVTASVDEKGNITPE